MDAAYRPKKPSLFDFPHPETQNTSKGFLNIYLMHVIQIVRNILLEILLFRTKQFCMVSENILFTEYNTQFIQLFV